MPKFYGQNKKRIDPRYFLDETVDSSRENESQVSAPRWQKVQHIAPPAAYSHVDLVGYQSGIETRWVKCDVYVNKEKYSIEAMFLQLNNSHEEFGGWITNPLREGSVDEFMDEMLDPAVDAWTDMLRLKLQDPDSKKGEHNTETGDDESDGYDLSDPSKPWLGDYGF